MSDRKGEGFVVGVDGGGTKTDVALCGLDGTLIARDVFGGTRIEILGVVEAVGRVVTSIRTLADAAGLPLTGLRAACLGLGGLDSDQLMAEVSTRARRLFPENCLVFVRNDAQVGLYSGTFGAPGICVVAGTGSLLVGMDDRRRWRRVGGWGSVFGDEGSAFGIAQKAIRAALRAFDGTGPSTLLNGLFQEELGISDLGEVVHLFPWHVELVPRIASLAPVVDQAAEAGDEVAREILMNEARTLASDAQVLAKLLRVGTPPITVVTIGGVFRSRLFRQAFAAALGEGVEIVQPTWRPVLGALLIALEEVGSSPAKECIESLAAGLAG